VAKGSTFERFICHMLDEWWHPGSDESYFWRTAGSGARATVRARKGKKTSDHHGDICAIHPSGKALLRIITMELKRGYPKATLSELVDRKKRSKPSNFEVDFFQKARAACKNTGAYAWMIIHQRNQRNALVYFPDRLMQALINVGAFPKPPCPFATVDTYFREQHGNKRKTMRGLICVTTLKKFLSEVTPDHIKKLAKARKRGERLI
jgi:hypothetical protein